MDDFFNDFDNDFDEGEFMDNDPIEEPLNCDFDSDDPLSQDDQIEHESFGDDDNGNFDIEDSFILGGALGFAYEVGLNERERKRLLNKHGKEGRQAKKLDDFR